MPEIVKRDGRRETYDSAKLARSLLQAGVSRQMVAGILANVGAGPDMDTCSLRAWVESALMLRQPSAARRYSTTRGLTARGSEQAGYGWVCLNPETMGRLGLRPGDTAWLSHTEEQENSEVRIQKPEFRTPGCGSSGLWTLDSGFREGTAAPFSVESLADVERGHAWLNRREMAAMGVPEGTKLTASSIYEVLPSPAAEGCGSREHSI